MTTTLSKFWSGFPVSPPRGSKRKRAEAGPINFARGPGLEVSNSTLLHDKSRGGVEMSIAGAPVRTRRHAGTPLMRPATRGLGCTRSRSSDRPSRNQFTGLWWSPNNPNDLMHPTQPHVSDCMLPSRAQFKYMRGQLVKAAAWFALGFFSWALIVSLAYGIYLISKL